MRIWIFTPISGESPRRARHIGQAVGEAAVGTTQEQAGHIALSDLRWWQVLEQLDAGSGTGRRAATPHLLQFLAQVDAGSAAPDDRYGQMGMRLTLSAYTEEVYRPMARRSPTAPPASPARGSTRRSG